LRVDPPPITRSILARLAAHDRPGNVRELANVLEAALVLGDGRTIRNAIEDALVATRGNLRRERSSSPARRRCRAS
jgi:DNA-binding NtrC family response regulator